MWHLQQFVARLDAVTPSETESALAPTPSPLPPDRAPNPAVMARLDCRSPEAGLGEWQVVRQPPEPFQPEPGNEGRQPLKTRPPIPEALVPEPPMTEPLILKQPIPRTVATMRLEGPLPTEAAARPAEAYVRGVDLVVEYGENVDGDRCELYYRALPEPARVVAPIASEDPAEPAQSLLGRVLGGVELWVSVQTRRLDSRPHVRIGNTFPAETQVLAVPGWLEPGLRVFRLPGIQVSYIESVYPADVADPVDPADEGSSEILAGATPGANSANSANPADPAASTLTSWTSLNVVWMEKGVIRRCRVRGWWVERDGDLELAAELTRRFLADPPPLTA
jgi:hypothetical protein